MEILFGIVYVAFVIQTGNMASTRDRSVVLWVILAIVISPLLSIILLACLGHANVKRKDQSCGDDLPSLPP